MSPLLIWRLSFLFFITDISILFAIMNFISLWYASMYVYRYHCQVKLVKNIYFVIHKCIKSSIQLLGRLSHGFYFCYHILITEHNPLGID